MKTGARISRLIFGPNTVQHNTRHLLSTLGSGIIPTATATPEDIADLFGDTTKNTSNATGSRILNARQVRTTTAPARPFLVIPNHPESLDEPDSVTINDSRELSPIPSTPPGHHPRPLFHAHSPSPPPPGHSSKRARNETAYSSTNLPASVKRGRSDISSSSRMKKSPKSNSGEHFGDVFKSLNGNFSARRTGELGRMSKCQGQVDAEAGSSNIGRLAPEMNVVECSAGSSDTSVSAEQVRQWRMTLQPLAKGKDVSLEEFEAMRSAMDGIELNARRISREVFIDTRLGLCLTRISKLDTANDVAKDLQRRAIDVCSIWRARIGRGEFQDVRRP